MKKFSAILLAVLMMLSMVAMAAGDASITITPPDTANGNETGITYKAYKIFDATISDSGVPAYSIHKDSPYFTTVQNSGYFTLTPTAGDADTYLVVAKETYTKEVANTFAETLEKVSATEAGTLTKQTDGTYKLDKLDNGYYLVTSSVGSDLILETIGDVKAATKNEYPSLDKKVDGDKDKSTADMGEELTFTIDVTIPEDAVGEIVVHDKMTGLAYQEMIPVEGVDGITVDVATTAAPLSDGCSVHFTLTADYVAAHKKETVAITYKAKVTADVANNEAWLVDGSYTSDKDGGDVDVYSTDVVINKYDKNSTATKLAGAVFVLKNSDGKFYKVATDGTVSWVDAQTDATPATTDANGAAKFENIANGTYYLVETKAPDGYNLMTEEKEIEVTAVLNSEGAVIDITADVANSTGSQLPSTGGMGTTIFYVVGGLMMAAAVVILAAKKKVSAK